MILLVSLAVATIFGAGAFLLLKRDFIKVVAGIVLVSQAANLFIMNAGLSSGHEPFYPIPLGQSVADPLVQAMTVTAVVISFGVSALVVALIYRVYRSHHSVDIDALADLDERLIAAEEDAAQLLEPFDWLDSDDALYPERKPAVTT